MTHKDESDHKATLSRRRGRGDRIELTMSLSGTSPTWRGVCGSVDIGGKADVAGCGRKRRSWTQAV
jgi:hypothetical protein